jgi:hypothetical protein
MSLGGNSRAAIAKNTNIKMPKKAQLPTIGLGPDLQRAVNTRYYNADGHGNSDTCVSCRLVTIGNKWDAHSVKHIRRRAGKD